MKTALDDAIFYYAMACKSWLELAAGFTPILGSYLSGWFWCDMGNSLPSQKETGEFKDSFRRGYADCQDCLRCLGAINIT